MKSVYQELIAGALVRRQPMLRRVRQEDTDRCLSLWATLVEGTENGSIFLVAGDDENENEKEDDGPGQPNENRDPQRSEGHRYLSRAPWSKPNDDLCD